MKRYCSCSERQQSRCEPHINTEQRFSWLDVTSMQVTHTYHSGHTAWLLDAKCLHYLEHIHNALCLATLSGIDE